MATRTIRATIGLVAVCCNALLTVYGAVAVLCWFVHTDTHTTRMAVWVYFGLAFYFGLPLFLLTRWGAPAGLWRKLRTERVIWETAYVRIYTYNLLLVFLLFVTVFTYMALKDAAQQRMIEKVHEEYDRTHNHH